MVRLGTGPRYTRAILNPPYKKIGNASSHRAHFRAAGLETVNLYSGFVGLALGQIAGRASQNLDSTVDVLQQRQHGLAIGHFGIWGKRVACGRNDVFCEQPVPLLRGYVVIESTGSIQQFVERSRDFGLRIGHTGEPFAS